MLHGTPNIYGYIRLQILMVNPRDPSNHQTLGILPILCISFQWLETPCSSSWDYDGWCLGKCKMNIPVPWIPLGYGKPTLKGGVFGGALKNAPETRPFCAQGRRSQELQVVGVCGLCVCVFLGEVLAWMSRWKLGSMVRINGFNPNVPQLYVGYKL